VGSSFWAYTTAPGSALASKRKIHINGLVFSICKSESPITAHLSKITINKAIEAAEHPILPESPAQLEEAGKPGHKAKSPA
jgi:hypothetical protein